MPGYDRTALVEQIRERLKAHAQFVSWQDQDTGLTMVVTGCPNACADIRAVSHKPLFFITRPQDAERFIILIRSENLKNELERLLPGKDRHS
nr:hypothetical protein [uncultured Desulfobacter sp.]